jgi:hypothetical protein
LNQRKTKKDVKRISEVESVERERERERRRRRRRRSWL